MKEKKVTEKQSLIEGNFHPDEASEIIRSLFNYKIQFHAVTALSIWVRTGQDPQYHHKRKEELGQSLRQILKVIEQAKEEGKYLRITSNVQITPTDKTA
jgi:hypothetical protein